MKSFSRERSAPSVVCMLALAAGTALTGACSDSHHSYAYRDNNADVTDMTTDNYSTSAESRYQSRAASGTNDNNNSGRRGMYGSTSESRYDESGNSYPNSTTSGYGQNQSGYNANGTTNTYGQSGYNQNTPSGYSSSNMQTSSTTASNPAYPDSGRNQSGYNTNGTTNGQSGYNQNTPGGYSSSNMQTSSATAPNPAYPDNGQNTTNNNSWNQNTSTTIANSSNDTNTSWESNAPLSSTEMARVSPETKVLSKLHAVNLEEQKIGRLAQQNGESSDVRQYGQMLVSDHTQSDDQVKRVAQEANIRVLGSEQFKQVEKAKTGQKRDDVVTQLSALHGSEFDRAFAQKMADGHRKLIDHLEKMRSSVQDAKVKALIDQTLPDLRHHEQMAKNILAGRPLHADMNDSMMRNSSSNSPSGGSTTDGSGNANKDSNR